MTDAEIIRHLAGVMGWEVRCGFGRCVPYLEMSGTDGNGLRYWPHDPFCTGRGWNPIESRDACAEVEAVVPEDKRWDYVMESREMVDPNGDRPNARTCTALVYATARQKCIAIVEATR